MNSLKSVSECLPGLSFEGTSEYNPTEDERLIGIKPHARGGLTRLDGALSRFGEALSDIEEHRMIMVGTQRHAAVC